MTSVAVAFGREDRNRAERAGALRRVRFGAKMKHSRNGKAPEKRPAKVAAGVPGNPNKRTGDEIRSISWASEGKKPLLCDSMGGVLSDAGPAAPFNGQMPAEFSDSGFTGLNFP